MPKRKTQNPAKILTDSMEKQIIPQQFGFVAPP
jgi:hypothetical protein